MSGWGTSITGLSQTISILEDLQIRYSGGTVYVVGPTVKYGVYNERGTSKMKARPFAKPAAEQVRANIGDEVRSIARSQGIDLSSEENVVRCAALAVQNRMKRIADAKGVRDTGDLIASITIEQA